MRTFPALLCAACALCYVPIDRLVAADEFERSPIHYSRSEPDNCVSRLQMELERGERPLECDAQYGYLPALLARLDVPVESQMLVFSKTSLQMARIAPRTPRAIYFNDNVYVGYCQNGDVLEISAVDRDLGTVFYTLNQQSDELPRFQRQTDNCLICHGSSRTEGVPGHLVRSLFVDVSGQPLLAAGSRTVDHTTPLADRWGGWYVTGTHGRQQHQGNLIIQGRTVTHPVENAAGQNVLDLSAFFPADRYLTPHSDIVALMVLEHQTLTHNRLTKANYATRQALEYDRTLKHATGDADTNWLDSTVHRIHSAGDDLIDALLLVDEAELSAPVAGTSGYAEVFSRSGPRDSRGRSLRDLDLSRRLFRYPCSPLIYSEAFDGLPDAVREYVLRKLWEILTGGDTSERYAHLSSDDRQAILEILRTTKPALPDYWH